MSRSMDGVRCYVLKGGCTSNIHTCKIGMKLLSSNFFHKFFFFSQTHINTSHFARGNYIVCVQCGSRFQNCSSDGEGKGEGLEQN